VFDKVYRDGATLNSPLCMVKTLKVQGKSRFSVAVTSKAARAATVRNRLRRQGYAILETTPLPTGLLAIFFIKKKAKQEDLKEEMGRLLQQIG